MRSPSPSRSPQPEKDTSHTSKGTDSLKAKFELVDDPMMPTDTVIPEKALGVKGSQPGPPSPPLHGTLKSGSHIRTLPRPLLRGGQSMPARQLRKILRRRNSHQVLLYPGIIQTASPSPLLQSYLHSSMGDGGGVTLSLLEGPFGCWEMVLMRVVDSSGRRLSPRSHSRRGLLLSGHISQRNILPLWTSKYLQHPAALEVVSQMVLAFLPIHAPHPTVLRPH
jgi:hypothetical protein